MKEEVVNGEYEDVSVEWVSGKTPTAYFYDENGDEIESTEIGNLKQDEIERFFIEHNFPLRRKPSFRENNMVQFEWGGHTYEFHPEAGVSDEAKKYASSRTVNNENGYVLVITSPEEQKFIDSFLVNNGEKAVWLGSSDYEEEGLWIWLGGEYQGKELTGLYTNWHESEPNNAGDNEHCAQSNPNQGWNDVSCNNKLSLIIEFGNKEHKFEEMGQKEEL